MSSSQISQEDKFVKNLQDFMTFGESLLSECHEKKITTLNPVGIGYAISFVNQRIKEKGSKWLVEEFIKKTTEPEDKDNSEKKNEDWKEIKNKNHKHFTKKLTKLLPILEESHAEELSRIFEGKNKDGTSYIEEEDKDAFFEYLFSFCKLSINYVHHNRKPVKHEDGFKYTVSFMGDFKVKDNAKLFEMELKI